jgi:hypothetical protein
MKKNFYSIVVQKLTALGLMGVLQTILNGNNFHIHLLGVNSSLPYI